MAHFSVESTNSNSNRNRKLTGKVPWARICDSARVMAGMERDSAQSQSRRPSLVGSLKEMLAFHFFLFLF